MNRKATAPRIDKPASRTRRRVRKVCRVGSLVYLAQGRKSLLEHFCRGLVPQTAQEILELLIWLMQKRLGLDAFLHWFGLRPYRPYFEDFHGCCQFIARDGTVKLLVQFKNGTVEMSEGVAPCADATITYADGLAVMNCLLSPIWSVIEHPEVRKRGEPDTFNILDGILNNTIQISGNPSYLFRFAFLSNYLLLELTGQLPNEQRTADL